ncbi:hypothetical protein RB653_003613 [Dictyostelium firmibasis]|uniref:Uncharacterized protein n=1 Tax=Dictyostelium firmibasis TaxID=79012 RepID=A0AAN7YVY6_9MYCE
MNLKQLVIVAIFLLSIVSNTYGSVVVSQGGEIPNKFKQSLTERNKKDLSEANAQIDYADIFKLKQGTIGNYGSIRIDMQGTFTQGGEKWHNLQAQINGISGSSTVAHVNVCENVMSTKTNEQKEVQRKVRNAMLQSLSSGKTYNVYNK